MQFFPIDAVLFLSHAEFEDLPANVKPALFFRDAGGEIGVPLMRYVDQDSIRRFDLNPNAVLTDGAVFFFSQDHHPVTCEKFSDGASLPLEANELWPPQ